MLPTLRMDVYIKENSHMRFRESFGEAERCENEKWEDTKDNVCSFTVWEDMWPEKSKPLRSLTLLLHSQSPDAFPHKYVASSYDDIDKYIFNFILLVPTIQDIG